MKITVFSDVHLGFGHGTEIFNDAFLALEEVVENSLDSDVVLVAGDIFDTKVPKPEVFARCMSILSKFLEVKSDVKVVSASKKGHARKIRGIPVIAIHGTHERRIRELVNPVQLMEKAGFLLHLHCSNVILEKGNERLCISGMSGVPESFARSVLEEWKPRPEEGCLNILMLHQNVEGHVFAEHFLRFEDFPVGFDMYVCGHIHEAKLLKVNDKPFLIPGSLVVTQMRKEAEKERGYWVVFTEENNIKEIKFFPLKKCRKFFMKTFENPKLENVEAFLDGILSERHELKPVVALKLVGNVEKTLISAIETKYGNRLMLNIKRDISSEIKIVKDIYGKSITETGGEIFKKNLRENKLDVLLAEKIFELVNDGKYEDAMKALMEMKTHQL